MSESTTVSFFSLQLFDLLTRGIMSRNHSYNNIYESPLNESYKDFDAQTITSYVKNFVKYVKDYEDIPEFLDDLNEYLEPLNVVVADEFGNSGYKWITPNIAFASMNEAGTISIEIGAEALLQDLIWDRENNYPYEKDTDFNQFLKELGQTIVHECVHIHQNSKGYPNKKWENSDPSEVGMWKYLASNDEVDAHAIAGVQEALDIGYSKEEVLDILSGKSETTKAEDLIHELNCTTDYYDWFCDSDDPRDQKVIKRLVKVMANEALKESCEKLTVTESVINDLYNIFGYPASYEDDFELFESKRLTEADKSRFINKIWPQIELNATDIMETVGQNINAELSGAELPTKDQVVAFANSNASDKYKIDWNDFNSHDNDTLWDATIKLISSCLSYSTSRKNKKDPKSQFQNEHFEILDENEDWLFVAVMDYKGAVYCDSYKCGGAGAKWCIGYEKSDEYWTDYTDRDLCRFVLAYNKKTYGNVKNQKYMIQLFPNNVHATQTWRQSDKPDEILRCNETLKKFNLTSNKIFEEWYNELSPAIAGAQSFSLAGIQNEAVTLSSVACTSSLELLPDETSEAFSINYVDMLRNVKGDPEALANIDWLIRSAQPDEKVLNLGNVRSMGSDPSDVEFVADSRFHPALLFRDFDTVYIKTLWLGYDTPTISFRNCKNVKIGRCYMPRPDSREDYLEALKTGNLEKAVRDNYLNINYAKDVNVTIDELAILPRNSLSKMDISKNLPAEHMFISTEDLGKRPIDVTGSERLMLNLLHITDAYNKPAVDEDNKTFYVDKAISNFSGIKNIVILNLPFNWKVTWSKEYSNIPRISEYPCSGEF